MERYESFHDPDDPNRDDEKARALEDLEGAARYWLAGERDYAERREHQPGVAGGRPVIPGGRTIRPPAGLTGLPRKLLGRHGGRDQSDGGGGNITVRGTGSVGK